MKGKKKQSGIANQEWPALNLDLDARKQPLQPKESMNDLGVSAGPVTPGMQLWRNRVG
jgi:hypothetical protein